MGEKLRVNEILPPRPQFSQLCYSNGVWESVLGPRGCCPGVSQGFLKRKSWVDIQQGCDSWVGKASPQQRWPLWRPVADSGQRRMLTTTTLQGQLPSIQAPCRQLRVPTLPSHSPSSLTFCRQETEAHVRGHTGGMGQLTFIQPSDQLSPHGKLPTGTPK